MPFPLIQAAASGCPTCEPTLCKNFIGREIVMIDWSARLVEGDTIASVAHAVAYLSGHSVNTTSLAVFGNAVVGDSITQALIISGRAGPEAHETELYRVTSTATTASGEILTQSFRVHTKDVYENAITTGFGEEDSRLAFTGDAFLVPTDNCWVQPPLICKTPEETRTVAFDFSDWLKLPNGDTVASAGSHLATASFTSGFSDDNALLISNIQPYFRDGVRVGTSATFSGGLASDVRGQMYHGYFRMHAGMGQRFFYPFSVQVKNPECGILCCD